MSITDTTPACRVYMRFRVVQIPLSSRWYMRYIIVQIPPAYIQWHTFGILADARIYPEAEAKPRLGRRLIWQIYRNYKPNQLKNVNDRFVSEITRYKIF